MDWNIDNFDVAKKGENFFNYEYDNSKEEYFPRHKIDSFISNGSGKELNKQVNRNDD